MEMMKFPACTRTIQHSRTRHSNSWRYMRLEFPELVFVRDVATKIYPFIRVMIPYRDFLWPLKFFNIQHDGTACSPGGTSIKNAVDLFWNTRFNNDAFDICHDETTDLFPLNAPSGEISLLEWEDRTKEDPGFMAREFDPAYYSRIVDKVKIT